ncbi:hypothetical protein BDV98DRAFT_655962 [Pterulicium gracile]|uniref:RRM domain-containing protein n=1 Tax=Pterulicium gracile TaxID=1884261 RepID=A0A5C3QJV7_9AGAR|nr:hypothetical protein BDV98DRAFT_655962 [Pterula gracilis]
MSASNRRTTKPYSRPAPSSAPEDGRWEHDLAPGAKRAPTGPRNGLAGLSKGTHFPNNKIMVSNLHYEVTAKDLTTIFGQIGTLTKEPVIRYDKSGRSSGVAFCTYSSIAEATQAKNQFNGILAKGQPMHVVYDTPPPAKRSISGPSTASLLNRVQKPALLDRLSKDDMSVPKSKAPQRTAGPIRNRRGAAAAAAPAKRSKKPATAEDLDKELDAFMKDDDEKPAAKSDEAKVEAAPEKQGDVEMT